MVWSKRREYIMLEIGDLDLCGWEYKAMIDVFYIYLLAVFVGASTGAFLIIASKKITNRQKRKSKEIEKIPRGGDTPDSGTDFSKISKEEFYKFIYEMSEYAKDKKITIDNASCFPKSGVSRVGNKNTARKIFDSLKKKSLRLVTGTMNLVITANLMYTMWTLGTALGNIEKRSVQRRKEAEPNVTR
jgi:hypothetical protein